MYVCVFVQSLADGLNLHLTPKVFCICFFFFEVLKKKKMCVDLVMPRVKRFLGATCLQFTCTRIRGRNELCNVRCKFSFLKLMLIEKKKANFN